MGRNRYHPSERPKEGTCQIPRAAALSSARKEKIGKLNLTDIFETGDLIAIQLHTAGKSFASHYKKKMSDEAFFALNGKYMLIQKIRCHISYSSSIVPEIKDHWAIFRLFDGVYSEVPKNVDITSLKDARFVLESDFLGKITTPLFLCESNMFHFKKRKYQPRCPKFCPSLFHLFFLLGFLILFKRISKVII